MKAKTHKTETRTRTEKEYQPAATQEVITVVSKASTKNSAKVTPETTLNELINIARNTAVKKPKTTPKFGTLHKKANCVASYHSDDYRSSLFVYDNGFAAYETDGRTTSIDLDELSSVKYGTIYSDLNMECNDFNSEWLGDLPWVSALTLLGEDQIEAQMSKDKAHDYASDDDSDNYDAYCEYKKLNSPALAVHIDDPETAYIRKETNREIRWALKKTRSDMTEKQAEAFALYYDQDMSEEEIGRILKISHQAVSQRLEVVKRNLRKNMEQLL